MRTNFKVFCFLFYLFTFGSSFCSATDIRVSVYKDCDHHINISVFGDGKSASLDRWREGILPCGDEYYSHFDHFVFKVDLSYSEVLAIYERVRLSSQGSWCNDHCADEVEIFFGALLLELGRRTGAELTMAPKEWSCHYFCCCLPWPTCCCCCTLPYSVFERIKQTIKKYPQHFIDNLIVHDIDSAIW